MALHRSVRETQDAVDAAEFAEWIEFYKLEPFGEERADLRSAIVACTVANAHRGKGQRAFQPKDFLPKFGPREPRDWRKDRATFGPLMALLKSQQKPSG